MNMDLIFDILLLATFLTNLRQEQEELVQLSSTNF